MGDFHLAAPLQVSHAGKPSCLGMLIDKVLRPLLLFLLGAMCGGCTVWWLMR